MSEYQDHAHQPSVKVTVTELAVAAAPDDATMFLHTYLLRASKHFARVAAPLNRYTGCLS